MLLKELCRGLQVAVDGGVFLIKVGKIEEGVVLDLITIVPTAARDVCVVMKITVGVVGVVAKKRAVVVQGAKLAGVVLR